MLTSSKPDSDKQANQRKTFEVVIRRSGHNSAVGVYNGEESKDIKKLLDKALGDAEKQDENSDILKAGRKLLNSGDTTGAVNKLRDYNRSVESKPAATSSYLGSVSLGNVVKR